MKHITAYIRPSVLEKTITELDLKGAPGITVVDVHSVGYGFEPNYFMETRELSKRIPQIVKLEIVCHNEQVSEFVEIIVHHASTGSHGDGRIFVSPVEEAIRVRDGKSGAEIL